MAYFTVPLPFSRAFPAASWKMKFTSIVVPSTTASLARLGLKVIFPVVLSTVISPSLTFVEKVWALLPSPTLMVFRSAETVIF